MRTVLALLAVASSALATDRFTGWQSCATSGCHGGGTGKNQVQIWQKEDPHARAYGILIAERSKRMGEALGIKDTAASAQCTVCHSPMQSAAPNRLAPSLKHPNLGVSCESCHGPAEGWLRYHTRPDITHTHRVAAGLRDLDSTYQRANSCIGCHGNLSAELLQAGHPTLRFELARQLKDLPPHWPDHDTAQAPGAWLTGQAVLLRELSWLSENGHPQPERIAALHWILKATQLGAEQLPSDAAATSLRKPADRLAKMASTTRWNAKKTRVQFDRFLALASDLSATEPPVAFARATVLTPALRAMTIGLSPVIAEKAKGQLEAMELAIRSPAVFDTQRYVDLTAELATAVRTAEK